MGWFDSFFHPENAYKKAQESANAGYQSATDAANKGYGEAQAYLNPYIQQGQQQYGNLMGAENALLNPEALLSKWSSGYQQSPYAQQLLGENMSQGQEAASQMGLNGSSAALGNIQQGAGNIVSKDREGYLDRLMKQYIEGIGLGKNIYDTGANAGSVASNNAMTHGTNMGNQAFEHGNNIAGLRYGEQAAPGNLFGKILGAGANMIPGIAATQGIQSWLGSANKFNPWGQSNANQSS